MTLPRHSAMAVAFVGMLLTAFSWAIASPVGAAPDEPAHIYYAWGTATGQTLPWSATTAIDGLGRTADVVVLPDRLTQFIEPGCYAQRDVTSSCRLPAPHDGSESVTTYMTRYPLAYYLIIGLSMRAGLAVGFTGFETLILARLFSGILSLATVLLAACLLARRFGAVSVVVPLSVAMVPMAWFLFSAINPNGFEMAMCILLTAIVVAVREDLGLEKPLSRGIALGLPAAVLVLSWTRPVGVVWAGLIVMLLLYPSGGSRKPSILRLGGLPFTFLAIAIVAGLGWFAYQTAGSPQDSSAIGSTAAWDRLPVLVQAFAIVFRFGDMAQSGFGTLGWLDTPIPTFLFVLWVIVGASALATMTAGANRPSTRLRHVGVMLVMSMLAIGAESWIAAFGWQGRYWYPMIMASLTAMVPAAAGALRVGERRAMTVVGVCMLIVLSSLILNVERYRFGYHTTFTRFQDLPWAWRGAAWEPAGGMLLLVSVAVVGYLLLAMSIWLTTRQKHRIAD